jgi:hypothetical protein
MSESVTLDRSDLLTLDRVLKQARSAIHDSLLRRPQEAPDGVRESRPPTRPPPPGRDPWELLQRPIHDWDGPVKDKTVQSSDGLRAAINELLALDGGVIEIEPGTYNEIKLNTPWPINPTWHWSGSQNRILLRCKGDVRINGCMWQSGGGEFWIDSPTLQTNIGGMCPIGSPGQIGQWRMRNPKFVRNPALAAGAWMGNDHKWGGRLYGGLLDIDGGDWSETKAVEHNAIYADNMAGVILTNCKSGPGGRTHLQTGTRVQFPRAARWMGILIDNFVGTGLNSGSGGGSGVTIYGYPGDVVLRDITIKSGSTGNLAQNRAISLWEPSNFGGTWDERNDYATYRAVLHKILVDYPGMQRPAFETESVEALWLGEMEGNCPKWQLDAPDQYVSGYVGAHYFIPETSRHGLKMPWPDAPSQAA